MKRIAFTLLVAITVLGACGAPGSTTSENAMTTTSSLAPTMPDLSNPYVRDRLACSFAPGYFADPAPTSSAAENTCDPLNTMATGTEAVPLHLPLYAYGTSYLADDTVNTPGRRYIHQFRNLLQPSEFHNFGQNGATVQQIALAVEATWRAQPSIVVIDALTNNLYQSRGNTGQGILAAEPVFRSMLERLGPEPSIIVVKQGHLAANDYAIFSYELSDLTVDAWNAMIDRAVAGLPNVRVVDPNEGWDADTMMYHLHPTDAGEDHIAQLLCAATGLTWRPPAKP
jgi:hypothetical protein